MELPLTIKEFMDKLGLISKSEFISKFKSPFLLLEIGLNPQDKKKYGTNSEKSASKKTVEINKITLEKPRTIFVEQVKKTSRNHFSKMITVGRTLNNDIIIHHPCVSKFHAFFKTDKSVTITDAGSSYGTKLDNKQLIRNRDYPLLGREIIIFAEIIKSTFLMPLDFYDYARLIN